MEKISNKSVDNYLSEKRIANNKNRASNHEIPEMSTTVTLRNISSILFDENNTDSSNVIIDKAALQAVERSFNDVLKQTNSSSPNLEESNVPQMFPRITNQIQNESLPSSEFERGMEEGIKFLPSINNSRSMVALQADKIWFHSKRKNDGDLVERTVNDGEKDRINMMLKAKKHANSTELSHEEGHKYKTSVLHYKNPNALLDKVFLLHEEHYAKEALRLRVLMQNGTISSTKLGIHENSVDLRTLLIHCSKAVASNDGKANQLIKQIKKHSSPYGDGVQRMAHIFVNGLEARLNGTGSELYKLLVPQGTLTITNMMSSFHMYLISCPTQMVLGYFTNYTILNAIKNKSKLHIINLGTDYGFYWPFLIHELSRRIDGPPKLRITNIKSPGSSWPADARQTLEFFSRSYGVPLEYRGLGTKWDNICIDDLNIEKDEVVIAKCYHGFEYLQKETDMTNDPNDHVLDMIRQIKPHVFIQSIINGSFSSSFFADRFRQVLHYASAMFDFFDATMPHNNKQRWFLENIIWGRSAINLISCEGPTRCVGAETYKQWHTRNSRAGLKQLLLDRVILKRINNKVREVYHENFFIDDDKEWLLWGWKGRVMSAISAWHSRRS